jgi:alkylhydroperoxidase family enzyme
MPRLRQVHTTDAHELAQTLYGMLFGERDPVDEPGTATGSPGDWWTVTALVPDLFDHIVGGFGFYRSGNRLLDPQLRELGQTRTGWARGSRFVYSQHVKACREVGLPEEKIQAIRAWAVADVFSATERAVLAYTDALVLQGGRVPDEVFDALRVELSEEEILELTYIVCTYDMHATMSKALRSSSTTSTTRSSRCRDPRAWARRRWTPCGSWTTSTPSSYSNGRSSHQGTDGGMSVEGLPGNAASRFSRKLMTPSAASTPRPSSSIMRLSTLWASIG